MDDQEAEREFATWAAASQARLLRAAYLVTGDRHRGEDLVQEALVKVALRWSRLRDGDPLAYARRIVVNDHVSWWRRRHREHSVADASQSPAAHGTSPGDPLDAPLDALVVRRALARLTPKQRAVVVLRHLDDLTERETADVLGVSVGTVKSQNAAALARLREGAPELADLIGGSR